jgi:hypothetical protein
MKVKAGKTTDTWCHLSAKEIMRTADIVAAVAANVKKNWPVTCKDISFAYGVSNGTKRNIL